jgi:hypothetical protein
LVNSRKYIEYHCCPVNFQKLYKNDFIFLNKNNKSK